MAAGERARRRAERERAAVEQAAAREAEAERVARRRARRDVAAGLLPGAWTGRSRSGAQTGTLAARRRQQTGLVIAFVLAVNVLVWLGTSEWAARAFLALLSVFIAPIVVSLITRK
ncbi:hypothetical protein ABFT23_14205 [Nocardioides sp. C4-1]|uniref:hypothetical protein n=1 Tax=Nocardioides sp. C4-1 TaxID=3151851 RepID=UPI0032642292